MPAPCEGERLGPYRIESVVARGGMATVFRAIDETTGLAVAIKMPRPELERDPLLIQHFRRELEIGRRLNHPGVVRILDGSQCGRLCIVMEWAEGRSLRQILNDGGVLPPEAVIRIALAVAEALEYVHGRGVAHRDLKPENLLIDHRGGVKIIDFGVATAGAFFMPDKTGQATGTPDYMSPEQVLGKRGDARSDIYALGVVLYEMLTGKVPFSGPNGLAVMNARLWSEPPSPREVDPSIPDQLDRAVRRALARDPKMRYAAVRDLARDLGGRSEPSKLRAGAALTYLALGMIPATIFALLLLAARHR